MKSPARKVFAGKRFLAACIIAANGEEA